MGVGATVSVGAGAGGSVGESPDTGVGAAEGAGLSAFCGLRRGRHRGSTRTATGALPAHPDKASVSINTKRQQRSSDKRTVA